MLSRTSQAGRRSGSDRRLGTGAALLVAMAAACATRDSLPPPRVTPAAPITIPLIDDAHGGLFVDAIVEGRAARLLLDTGASCSTLATRTAREWGVGLVSGSVVEGTAGVVAAERARLTIELPGAARRVVDAAVYEFGSHDAACVGILGNDVLGQRPFRVDYARKLLEWGIAEAEFDLALPLELDHVIPRVLITVGGLPLAMRIDTGAALAPGPDLFLNVTRREARAAGAPDPRPRDRGAPVRPRVRHRAARGRLLRPAGRRRVPGQLGARQDRAGVRLLRLPIRDRRGRAGDPAAPAREWGVAIAQASRGAHGRNVAGLFSFLGR